MLNEYLLQTSRVIVKQVVEDIEILGVEGRNKYQILTAEGHVLAQADEERGLLGTLMRQLVSHWRSFRVDVDEPNGQCVMRIHHPFRFYFQHLYLEDGQGRAVGEMRKQWSLFGKKFVLQARGGAPIQMSSGFFRVWNFPFTRDGVEIATVNKSFDGVLRELFTDADTFQVQFLDASLSLAERQLLVAAAIFIDLQYFEDNQVKVTSLFENRE